MEAIRVLKNRHILLGVTGSIAVYKAVDLASKLTQAGAQVDVIMTEAAQRFVTPLSFQSVTGRPVYTDLWGTEQSGGLGTHIAHVGLGEGAALLAIVPATANTLAKIAGGLADDLLSVTALAARCPLLIAPAMDGGMYQHPATQANVATLVERGAVLVEPEVGRFASGLVGQGRLPETPTLLGHIRWALGRDGVLAGRRVVVPAGAPREPLDPVRYISNYSSGKQGTAIAQAALDAGAQVTLITSAALPTPIGAQVVAVESAAEMNDAVLERSAGADVLVMAAAVADYRPAQMAAHKMKKEDAEAPTLTLKPTPDILMNVKGMSHRPKVVVGFAAESDDLLANAQSKLQRKALDLLVANDITASDAGFHVDTNRVVILDRSGSQESLDLMRKSDVAEVLIGRISGLLK